MNLNYEVAVSCMMMLANMGRQGVLEGLGVSRADFDRFVGGLPWMSSDRNRMSNMLHAFAFASLDAQGLPRFTLPAEYLAAVICIFVHPVNMLSACVVAPRTYPAEEQGRGVQETKVTPEILFALVVQLCSSSHRGQARASFEKASKLILDNQPVSSSMKA